MTRVFNFNAGPAVLPREVLEEAQNELLDFRGSGISILEASHRGPEYRPVHEEAQANLRRLLDVPESHAIAFMQGGSSTQFALVPMNLRPQGASADYAVSGAWAQKAYREAARTGAAREVANTAKEIPTRMPRSDELDLDPDAAYFHITSNETISGAQYRDYPETVSPDVPLIADMCSDILSQPIDVSKFGLIHASAQKNLGPAGLSIVILRKDLAERAPKNLASILSYKAFIEKDSMLNTPPTFSIYMLMLVTRWIDTQGGLEAIARQNKEKAGRLYAKLDASDFYKGTTVPEYRSLMNVTFRLPSEELEKKFIEEAGTRGLMGLKGHRSVGGLRASLYNAFPLEGVDALLEFMNDFEKRSG